MVDPRQVQGRILSIRQGASVLKLRYNSSFTAIAIACGNEQQGIKFFHQRQRRVVYRVVKNEIIALFATAMAAAVASGSVKLSSDATLK